MPSQSTSGLENRRVAFIQSSWHESLVERCRSSFVHELSELGIPEQRVEVFRVPGAFEIPLLAKRAMRTGRFDVVVASALVVDGGIYRHEFVAQSVLDALMRAQMESDVPLVSLVLTPHHFHEHEAHEDFFGEHLARKGAEGAHACVGALAALDELAAAVAP
ncbi:MAG: 6,7-dimethyl-8-ribityllumazine synthase [Solirubrobacteraceae bacterium]